MNYQEILDLFFDEADRQYAHKFKRPRLDTSLKGACAGRAYLMRGTLKLNGVMMQREGLEAAYETIGHEAAHFMAWQMYDCHDHGDAWKVIMVRLGLKPTRCHAYKPAGVIRYEYSCACGTPHELTTYRHKRSYQYRCKTCKTGLTYVRTIKT